MLNDRLVREFAAGGAAPVSPTLKTMLPRQLGQHSPGTCVLPPDLRCHGMTRRQRSALLELLADFRATTRTRLIGGVTVTSGGVSLETVDPRTMEPRIIRGRSSCGEVLDVDSNHRWVQPAGGTCDWSPRR